MQHSAKVIKVTMKRFFYAIIPFAAVFLASCANVVAPTGGPKDETPPIVLSSKPENGSTNFDDRTVRINFDEYVVLKDAQKNIMISPPPETHPNYRLNGKTLVIRFAEPLKENTTYSISLGEAVKDLHEENALVGYSLIFSTGDMIDTLSISGKVVQAQNLQPTEDIYAMLYKADSLPMDSVRVKPKKQRPDFVTLCDKNGNFSFHGLGDNKFFVFALKSNSTSLKYDHVTDEIAFCDSLVTPVYQKPVDTVSNDSIANDSIPKTVFNDSIPQNAAPDDTISKNTAPDDSLHTDSLPKIVLKSFVGEDSIQKILKKELVEYGHYRFVFRYPADKVNIEVLDTVEDSFKLIRVPSKENDTVHFFYSPERDSLNVRISFDTISDTLRIPLKARQKKRQKKSEEAVIPLTFKNNIKANVLVPGQNVEISFAAPIVESLPSENFLFVCERDTLSDAFSFEKIDSLSMIYRLKTDKKFEEEKSYKITVPDSVFIDVRGCYNKSQTISFKMGGESMYGNLFVKIRTKTETPQIIVQLLDEKDKVIGKQILEYSELKSKKVSFLHLTPGKYKLKAIIDTDGNGKWSTGNLERGVQPEEVSYHKDTFEIRANWDIDLDEEWVLDD